MKKYEKTNKRQITELEHLRQRIAELEQLDSEYKRMEETLREGEGKYRDLINGMNDTALVIDFKGNFIDANDAAVEVLGYSREALLLMKPQDIDIHLDQKEINNLIKKTAKDKQQIFETIHTTKDGKKIPVEIKSTLMTYKGKQAILCIARDISERKQMEETLQESERRFRNVVETMKVGLSAIDESGVLTYVNEYFATMVGYSIDEMIGRPTVDFYYDEESRKEQEERFRRRRAGFRDPESYEIILRRRDSQKVYSIVSPTPLFDADGHFKGSFAIHTNITERKLMEETLRESEEKYRELMNGMHDTAWVIDYDGHFIDVNDAAVEVLGYSREELLAMGPNDIDFNLDAETITGLVKGMAADKLQVFETAHTAKDGSVIPVEIKSSLVTYQGKEAILSIARDITERKQAEIELRESEEKYRTFFEHAGFAISLFDAETGERVAFNTMAHESLGYTREEFQNLTAVDITINRDSEKRKERFKKIIKNGSDLYELQLVAKNGEVRDELISAIPMRMHGRDFIQMIRVDITDQKRADKELKASFEMLRQGLESTISALASALELRDPYTAGHQQRVADLACAIAEEMGLSEEQIDGIRMAGLIHDIGKINIPAEILNKPGQLTEIEYSLFKNHPQVGHDVLQNVEFPWPVAQIVLQHHERMDGSGYPQGLAGDEIMLEARILAVADIVEAIASHRPYRPARGAGDALEEILHNKSTLYDPEVVEACLRVFYEKGFTFEKFLQVFPVPKIH